MTGSVIDRGNGKWLLKWDAPRAAGEKRKQHYKVIAGSKGEAKKALRAELSKIDSGQYIAPTKATFGDCIDTWLKIEEGTASPKTLESYQNFCKKHIRPRLGHHAVQAITTTMLVEMYADLRAVPLAPRTICHIHRLVFSILARAVSGKRVSKNVAGELERKDRPKPPDEEIEVLDEKQTGIVLDAFRGKSLYPLVAVAMSTGVRRGELLALRWNDVDFERAKLRIDESLEQTKAGGLRIKGPKTKSGRRIISLPPSLVADLRLHWKDVAEKRLALGMGTVPSDAYLFGHIDTGLPRSPNALTREFTRAIEKLAGVPRVGIHALRHSHASQLLRGGVDIVTVSKRLGHAKPDITLRVYSHLMPGADDAAAAVMEKALSSQPRTR